MATSLSLIVDDLNVFNAGSTGWDTLQLSAEASLYKGTSRYASGPANFAFSFKGTSVAFIGNLDSPYAVQRLQIDNGTVFNVTYDDPRSRPYGQWFQSPTLSEGDHTINVTSMGGTSIDFAIVNAGNHTRLAGTTVIVDNDNPLILYSGLWNRSTSLFFSPYRLLVGYPYGNSTHRSSTPSDTFTFRFTGTSVSVYGILSYFKMGNLAATYAIDGEIISYRTYNITSFYVGDGPGDEVNFLYFNQDNLPAGDHTLVVNVTLARHLDFILDYITYRPSFDTLLSMPLLNNTTTTIPSVSIDSYPSPTPQPSQVQTSGTPQKLTVAIVGGMIGALALAAILGTWLFLERRKARQTKNVSHYQDDANNLQPQPQHQPQPVKFNTAMQATTSHLPAQPPNNDNPAPRISSPPPCDTTSQARSQTQYIIAI